MPNSTDINTITPSLGVEEEDGGVESPGAVSSTHFTPSENDQKTATDKPKITETVSNDSFYPGLIFRKCILPKFCQGTIFLMVLLCVAIVGQGMIVSGQLPITLSMLEKNFGYNSVETGIIHSCYDAFFGITSIVVGLFSRKRKVAVIGVGILIIAVGCFTFTLPHFIHNYKGSISDIDSSTSIIKKPAEYGVCDPSNEKPTDSHHSRTMGHLVLFCLGYSLIGIGAAPLHTLAVVYLDEHLTPHMNGIFLGVYYFFGAVGPALGFGLGYPFLSYHVTLKKDPNSMLTPDSEGWVGAWWIGYIFGGVLLTLTAIPTMFYPSIKKPNVSPSSDESEKHSSSDVTSGFTHVMKSIWNYIKSFGVLIRNIPYVLLIAGMTIEGIAINGLGTFLSKILEVQFRVSSSRASLLSGAIAVVGAGAGILLGGLLVKKLPSKLSKAITITTLSVLSGVLFSSFFIGCPSREIQKIKLNDKFEITGEKFTCQKDCNCFSEKYEPVCLLDTGITYYSACEAGCKLRKKIDNKLEFTNCSCVESSKAVLQQGGCNKECKLLWWFMIVSFLALFLNFFIYVPQITLTLQLLDNDTKSAGTGLQQICIRIGFIIAPIIYGYFLDLSCILWSPKKSNSKISNCLEYNNPKMRLYLSLSSILIKIGASLCYFSMIFFLRDTKISHKKMNQSTNNI